MDKYPKGRNILHFNFEAFLQDSFWKELIARKTLPITEGMPWLLLCAFKNILHLAQFYFERKHLMVTLHVCNYKYIFTLKIAAVFEQGTNDQVWPMWWKQRLAE